MLKTRDIGYHAIHRSSIYVTSILGRRYQGKIWSHLVIGLVLVVILKVSTLISIGDWGVILGRPLPLVALISLRIVLIAPILRVTLVLVVVGVLVVLIPSW